jgi:hypothetical protein
MGNGETAGRGWRGLHLHASLNETVVEVDVRLGRMLERIAQPASDDPAASRVRTLVRRERRRHVA